MSEYEAQAEKFLKDHGLTFVAALKDTACPLWDDGKHIHGDRYRVTIKRTGERRSISFDFWNSANARATGERLTAYDVLACISSDATLPDDPDELIAELGPMKAAQAMASVRFTKRLQAFFSADEIDALGEIR